MTLTLTVMVGVIFPLVVMGLGQLLFHSQANGSLITSANGRVVGSTLIGQNFTKPQYFYPRLSAAGKGYDAAASSGTNLGPTSKTLLANTLAQAALVRKENHLPPNYPLPADAVSTSASGLDPDISLAYAELQLPRVAAARGMSQTAVRALLNRYQSGRFLGILGEPRVNVLELNLALDRAHR
jgi:K+-transporting ATPase ATPase C chain